MPKPKPAPRPSIVELHAPERARDEPNGGVNWTPDHRIEGAHVIPSWRIRLISRAIARRSQTMRFKLLGF